MSIISKDTLKASYQTGDIPTQSDFVNLIDSVNVPVVVNMTYASTVWTDCSLGDIFRVTVTGDFHLAMPTNCIDGKIVIWEIRQGDDAPHVITLEESKFVIPSNAVLPLSWSTEYYKTDILAARYHGGRDKFYVLSLIGGY